MNPKKSLKRSCCGKHRALFVLTQICSASLTVEWKLQTLTQIVR